MQDMKQEKKLDDLISRLEKIIRSIDSSGIEDLIELRLNMRENLRRTFLMAIVRGVGTAIGFTILGAVILYILQKIAMANLPLIGDALAEIARIINENGR